MSEEYDLYSAKQENIRRGLETLCSIKRVNTLSSDVSTLTDDKMKELIPQLGA